MRVAKLFYASTIVPKYADYRNVRFDWFVGKRPVKLGVHYAGVIERYESLDHDSRLYAEAAIDEMFTEAEVQAFAAWLQELHGVGCDIVEVALPIPGNERPISGVPCEHWEGYYMLHESRKYSLPFEVDGLFDTSSAKYEPPPDSELHDQVPF